MSREKANEPRRVWICEGREPTDFEQFMVNAKRLPRKATLAKLLVSYNVTPEAHACRVFNALLSLE